MSASNYRTIVVPAAVGAQPGVVAENVNGKVFATISSTDKFFVRADNRASLEQNSGRTFGNPSGPEFGRLIFQNFTAAPNTITYYAGNEMYQPDSAISAITANVTTSGKNAPTYPKGTTGTVAGAGLAFTGADGVGQVRKAFSIFNKETAASGLQIIVKAQNAAECHRIDGRQGYVMESGGYFSIWGVDAAEAGANVKYSVCEVFYA